MAILTLLLSEFVKQREKGALKAVNLFPVSHYPVFSRGVVCHPTVSTVLASYPLPSPWSTDSQAIHIFDLSGQLILGLCTQPFSSSLGHWGKGAATTSWRTVRQDRSYNWFCWKRRKGYMAVLTSGRLKGATPVKADTCHILKYCWL